jgi:hypothetical protein
MNGVFALKRYDKPTPVVRKHREVRMGNFIGASLNGDMHFERDKRYGVQELIKLINCLEGILSRVRKSFFARLRRNLRRGLTGLIHLKKSLARSKKFLRSGVLSSPHNSANS